MSALVQVCVGVGGTGKTTTAAAMAVGHALAGRRTVVLTIDPARRLADALGLEALGNRPRRVEVPGARGTLDALMLDRKATWDEIVRRHAPSPEIAGRILENRYYRAVSTRLTGSHEYMAVEKLHELAEAGHWDVVVLDTPPAQHVLEFFQAPDRVRRIFDRGVLGTLVDPGRALGGGLVGSAGRKALRLLERLAGASVMQDIAEFFSLIGGMSGGFRDRSAQVAELLRSERASYWLVADARAPERNDPLAFLAALRERGMRFGGFLVNRATPDPGLPDDWGPHRLPAALEGLDAETWAAWREALGRLPHAARAEARAQREAARRLSSSADGAPVWLVPEVTAGLDDVAGLAALARHLPPLAARAC